MDSLPIPYSLTTCLVVGIPVITSLLFIGNVFYNLFLHPLRSYPGPLLWRASLLPKTYHFAAGDVTHRVREFHDKYGPVVRIGPNELAYGDADAFREIYGARAGGYFPKYKGMYGFKPENAADILTTSDPAEASFLRHRMDPAFTAEAARLQEPVIAGYADMFVRQIHEASATGAPQDLRDWFTWYTFDVISYLIFASDFGGLRERKTAEWVSIVVDNIRINGMFAAVIGLGATVRRVALWAMSHVPVLQLHQRIIHEKVEERRRKKGEPWDLLQTILPDYDTLGPARIDSNASILTMAGSETAATSLSATLFGLLTNPTAMEKLKREVRGRFFKDDEITLESVTQLPYMLACISEGLRWHPPPSFGFPRVVHLDNIYIAGRHVPKGTIVAAWTYSIARNPAYYTDMNDYVPERFLGQDPRYKNDRLTAVQIFSVGPRNCPGRNIAYAEIRLLIARLILNFDITLHPSSRGWATNQPAYHVWDKPPLLAYLKPLKE